MAVVNTVGIHDSELTPEVVAARLDEVMAVTPEAVAQTIPLPAPAAG